jgi:hypothetical protein
VCRFDKFNICMRTCVRAHYAHIRARVMNSSDKPPVCSLDLKQGDMPSSLFSELSAKHTISSLVGNWGFYQGETNTCKGRFSGHSALDKGHVRPKAELKKN